MMKRIGLNLLGVVAVSLALNLQLITAFSQGTGYTLLTTYNNPTPAKSDRFAWSVAAVGIDRVLIGAYEDNTGAANTGAAYLFRTNGALLATFTNPTPVGGDFFGISVAAVGTDQLLIGAHLDNTSATDAGAAYLFSTSGTLLTTFTNPTPAARDYFGYSVAAVGTDRVVIGAYGDNTGATATGAAYLFNTNGTLLTTFTNPTPASGDYFGYSVAAVGTDRVLIGAYGDNTGAVNAGAAYLMDTNGVLLTTFTNPTPTTSGDFAYSVAAVGTGRVLIGALYGIADASGSGAAFLFNTNGTLLTTFTNPTPASGDYFGYSVAAVGTDRVLIGAGGDSTVASAAGAAFLFSTSGALLATYINPMPATNTYFGCSVAAVAADRVLIGAYGDNTGASMAGAAYLFSIPVPLPSLTIRLTSTNTVVVSWPSASTGWTLQENTNGVASVNWSNAPGPIQDDGTTKTLIVTPSAENRFYRLFKP